MRTGSDTHLDALEIRAKGSRTGVFSTRRILPGEVILRMQGDLLERPNKYSIQIAEGLHLDEGGLVDDEMNHSCVPNAYIDFSDVGHLVMRALRVIEPDHEVAINYCASEEVLVHPFACDCGSRDCYGLVSGYRDLTDGQKAALERYLSPYLRTKYSRGSGQGH